MCDSVNVEALINLGLKRSQAKVFDILYRIGPAEASAIAKAATIPRPDIYRILLKLKELGLVEKIIGHPSSFEAVSIETGVALLWKIKSQKYNELKYQSISLIQRLNKNSIQKNLQQKSHFRLIPSKGVIVRKLHNKIQETNKSIDIITSWKRFKLASYNLADSLEEAWKRGVKGRAIINNTNDSALDLVRNIWKTPYAAIKCICSTPKTVISIFDKKEAFIFVEPTTDLTGSPALWSNNTSLMTIANGYFESEWKDALNILTNLDASETIPFVD